MAEVVRKQRTDAGVIRETARDTAALQWLSEQYGAPLDLIEVLLDVSRVRAYQVVQRWREAGWVHTGKPAPGAMWVWPTAGTARRMLGRDTGGEWAPRPSTAAHTRAAAAVRLAWCSDQLEQGGERQWISERELRQRTGYRSSGERVGHLPDGVWIDSDGRQWLVEVEITGKGTERTYRHVLAASATVAREGSHGLLYFVTAASEADVRAAAPRIPGEHGRDRIQIERIDTGKVKGWSWEVSKDVAQSGSRRA